MTTYLIGEDGNVSSESFFVEARLGCGNIWNPSPGPPGGVGGVGGVGVGGRPMAPLEVFRLLGEESIMLDIDPMTGQYDEAQMEVALGVLDTNTQFVLPQVTDSVPTAARNMEAPTAAGVAGVDVVLLR